jgi:phosphosulfolactate synthase (CoM biosynthesis protein A)
MRKQCDIYVSYGVYIRVLPLTEAGIKAYNELAFQCLEAGIGVNEIPFHDRARLVRQLRKAGYSVTSRLPKTDYDHMTNDQILEALGLEA